MYREEAPDPQRSAAFNEVLDEADHTQLPPFYWEGASGTANRRYFVGAHFPGDWDPLCEDQPYYASRDQARFAAHIHRANLLAPERIKTKQAVASTLRQLSEELVDPDSALAKLVTHPGVDPSTIAASLADELARRAQSSAGS